MVAACGEESSTPPLDVRPPFLGGTTDAIEPLPAAPPRTAKVDLGERLFCDPGLSADGEVSCASCHRYELALTDGKAKAQGAGRVQHAYNAPTLFNAALCPTYNWTGRFTSLEAQHDALMKNPAAMKSSWDAAVRYLHGAPGYRDAFADVYQGSHACGASDEIVCEATVRDALVAFEQSLVTPDSPFDRFLRGDASALSAPAREGWALFKSAGCISCHQGPLVGGNLFQKLGVMRDYFAERGDVREADKGRFAVTGRDEDLYVFRVPSLRNVAATAPFFHDGTQAELEDAVQAMGRYQLGRELSDDDTARLVAFLRSLSGTFRGRQLP